MCIYYKHVACGNTFFHLVQRTRYLAHHPEAKTVNHKELRRGVGGNFEFSQSQEQWLKYSATAPLVSAVACCFQSIKELGEMFQKMLKEGSSEQFPVTLLLDSLDQLDPSNSARQLTWLPTNLPNHVKVIVSTLPEAQYEAFPKLQVRELVSPVYSCSLLFLTT